MIKFRVFNKKYNNYLSPIEIGNMLWAALKSNDYILEQFTGLHDKNGKAIYVGDIVSHDTFDYKGNLLKTEVGVCRYNEEWGVFMFHTSEDISEAFTFFSVGYETGNSTVVGNIHENKERLKLEKYIHHNL